MICDQLFHDLDSRWASNHNDWGGVFPQLIADDKIAILPSDSFGIEDCVDGDAGCRFAVGIEAARCHQPLIAVALPRPFNMAAIGVEYPGSDFSSKRIPANPLHAVHNRLVLNLDREASQQEIAIV